MSSQEIWGFICRVETSPLSSDKSSMPIVCLPHQGVLPGCLIASLVLYPCTGMGIYWGVHIQWSVSVCSKAEGRHLRIGAGLTTRYLI